MQLSPIISKRFLFLSEKNDVCIKLRGELYVVAGSLRKGVGKVLRQYYGVTISFIKISCVRSGQTFPTSKQIYFEDNNIAFTIREGLGMLLFGPLWRIKITATSLFIYLEIMMYVHGDLLYLYTCSSRTVIDLCGFVLFLFAENCESS